MPSVRVKASATGVSSREIMVDYTAFGCAYELASLAKLPGLSALLELASSDSGQTGLHLLFSCNDELNQV